MDSKICMDKNMSGLASKMALPEVKIDNNAKNMSRQHLQKQVELYDSLLSNERAHQKSQTKALQRANLAIGLALVSFIALFCILFQMTIMQSELQSVKQDVRQCQIELKEMSFDQEDLYIDKQDLSFDHEDTSMDQEDPSTDHEDSSFDSEDPARDTSDDLKGAFVTEQHKLDFSNGDLFAANQDDSTDFRVKRDVGDSKIKVEERKSPNDDRAAKKSSRRKIRFSSRYVMSQLEKIKKIIKKERRSNRRKREAQDQQVDKNLAFFLRGNDKAPKPISDVIKMWKKEEWVRDKHFEYSMSSGTLKVKNRGIYLIYAQLMFFSSEANSGFGIIRKNGTNTEALTKCLTDLPSSPHTSRHPSQPNRPSMIMRTCSTIVTAKLDEEDLLSLEIAKHGDTNPTVMLHSELSHWGLHLLYYDD